MKLARQLVLEQVLERPVLARLQALRTLELEVRVHQKDLVELVPELEGILAQQLVLELLREQRPVQAQVQQSLAQVVQFR